LRGDRLRAEEALEAFRKLVGPTHAQIRRVILAGSRERLIAVIEPVARQRRENVIGVRVR
jgi:hypothetical protein